MASKEFNKELEIIDREMYDFYRKNRRKVAKGIDQYNYWVKAMAGMIITIKKLMVENENGIYIEGLGYMCMEKVTERKRRISPLKKIIIDNYKTIFILEDKELRQKYRFIKDDTYKFNNRQEKYEPKFDAVVHEIKVKKDLKWKK